MHNTNATNARLDNTTNTHHYKKKHVFLKGPTWLNYSHWPREMAILIKCLGYEKHKLLLNETIY
jgi:hypothetical protein